MATTTSAILSPLFLTHLPNPSFKNRHFLNASSLVLVSSQRRVAFLKNPSKSSIRKNTQIQAAESADGVSKPLETAQEIMAARGDGLSTIISTLLLAAFVGLSILTIGVIYISVTDYLQKREKEKFVKEEEAAAAAVKKNKNKKKSGRRR